MNENQCTGRCCITQDSKCCWNCEKNNTCKLQCSSYKEGILYDDCFYRKIIVKRDTNVTAVTGSWSIPSRGVPETKIKISTKIKNWFRFNVAWRFYRYPPED